MSIRWAPFDLAWLVPDEDWTPPPTWADLTALVRFPPETTIAVCPGQPPMDPFTGRHDPTVDRRPCDFEWLIGWQRGQSAVSLTCTDPWCGWEGMWFRPPTSLRRRAARDARRVRTNRRVRALCATLSDWKAGR